MDTDIEAFVPNEFIEKIYYRLRQVHIDISQRVEEAFRYIPRRYFVPSKYKSQAYSDRPLPIASGQTISAPHMYAMMMGIEAGDPRQNMTILEVGAGSGYGAALLGFVSKPGKVYSIERHEALVDFAKSNISNAGVSNVEIISGDGTKDIPNIQFDRIIVTAAAKSFPEIYIDHLKIGGKIVIPLCDLNNDQWIWVYTKEDQGIISKKRLMQVVFVPLIY